MTAGFFAVFDDIATLLDKAATMSKVATKNTVGILGDDLAVNAQKASGFTASRELPVLWKITKGSLKNKLIILPLAFLLSAFAPWAITPILLFGGVYLAYEGAEKILDYFLPHDDTKIEKMQQRTQEEIVEFENKKIKSAILTDFILSIEIVIIALGSVIEQTLLIQIIAVTFVAIVATIGVYGLVALLVRMDDFGFTLIEKANGEENFTKKFGELLVRSLPKAIQFLTFIGTIAMLLVSGGIFMHNIHQVHELFHHFPILLAELVIGLVVGTLSVGVHLLYTKIKG
jgi:predicted DNA repair protein MutK